MPRGTKAKAKAKGKGKAVMVPRELPHQLKSLQFDLPMSLIRDNYYGERDVQLVVEYLLECSTADLEYWLRMLTTFRPFLMQLIAHPFSAKRRREEIEVNTRKRLCKTLAVQPNGVIRAGPSVQHH